MALLKCSRFLMRSDAHKTIKTPKYHTKDFAKNEKSSEK